MLDSPLPVAHKFLCDRCGADCSPDESKRRIFKASAPSIQLDLCAACRKEMEAWLKTPPEPPAPI